MTQLGDGFFGPGAIEEPKGSPGAPPHDCRQNLVLETCTDPDSGGKTGVINGKCGVCDRQFQDEPFRVEEPPANEPRISIVMSKEGKFLGLTWNGVFEDAKTALEKRIGLEKSWGQKRFCQLYLTTGFLFTPHTN